MTHTVWYGHDDCKRYRSYINARKAFVTAALKAEDVVLISKRGSNYTVSQNASEIDKVTVSRFKKYADVAELLDNAFSKY